MTEEERRTAQLGTGHRPAAGEQPPEESSGAGSALDEATDEATGADIAAAEADPAPAANGTSSAPQARLDLDGRPSGDTPDEPEAPQEPEEVAAAADSKAAASDMVTDPDPEAADLAADTESEAVTPEAATPIASASASASEPESEPESESEPEPEAAAFAEGPAASPDDHEPPGAIEVDGDPPTAVEDGPPAADAAEKASEDTTPGAAAPDAEPAGGASLLRGRARRFAGLPGLARLGRGRGETAGVPTPSDAPAADARAAEAPSADTVDAEPVEAEPDERALPDPVVVRRERQALLQHEPPPPEELEAAAAAEPADEPAARVQRRHPGVLGFPVTAQMVVLTLLVTGTFLMFLGVEPTPRWALLLGALITVFAVDGTLRAIWRRPFEGGEDTTPYLFLPSLYVIGVPVLIEHNIIGWWVALAGIGAGLGFGLVLAAEVMTVRKGAPEYPVARFIATSATYFVAFSLLSLTYVFGLEPRTAVLAVGLIAAMLAIELLREGEVDPLETLVFAGVTGLAVAQVRWALHYMPVDGYLAGLTLVLAFFFVTGLLHAHLTRALNVVVAAEYAVIAAIGVAVVSFARVAGVA